jgi:hypothetical protein
MEFCHTRQTTLLDQNNNLPKADTDSKGYTSRRYSLLKDVRTVYAFFISYGDISLGVYV